jgi:hypothetical protein
MSANIPFASRAPGSFGAVDVRVFLANGEHIGSTAIIDFETNLPVGFGLVRAFSRVVSTISSSSSSLLSSTYALFFPDREVDGTGVLEPEPTGDVAHEEGGVGVLAPASSIASAIAAARFAASSARNSSTAFS